MQAELLAPRAPSPEPIAIVGQDKLWSHGVFEMTIPYDLNIDEVESHTFGQFPRRYKGGIVNHYLFDEYPESLEGKTIKVELTLYRRSYADQRSFFAVEMKKVDDTKPVTHRLVIEDRPGVVAPKGAQVFDCPPQKVRVFITVHKSMQGFKAVSTGNSQVDRMVNHEGWCVAGETDTTFTLTKEGGRETVVHKPKDKSKKKK